MRKTKIICTIGPATDNEKVLRKLIRNGMDVARINFSHGTYDEHQKRIDKIKQIREQEGKNVALLIDTKGPEIRTGMLREACVILRAGDEITLTTREVLGDNHIISINYKNFPRELRPGDKVMLDDGLIELEVLKTTEEDVCCKVLSGGTLGCRKGVNLPGIKVQMPYMSERDKEDILFGIRNDVDFVAASFVRNAKDIQEIRNFLNSSGGSDINIIAKIENNEGIENIDEIIEHANGIMIARGDMGVEIPIEGIPSIQKMIIKKCFSAGKVAITATQMLDSMIRHPRPTRAEVTDVANAIYDGTSAIMLSGETAAGKYPDESFMMMDKIARITEADIDYKKRFNRVTTGRLTLANAISHAACTTAHDLEAAAILAVTKSGHTARMVSRFRPHCPIIATTTSLKVCRQLALSWGVRPLLSKEKKTIDEVFEHSIEIAAESNAVKKGDIIVMMGGSPVGVSGTTNFLKVHVI